MKINNQSSKSNQKNSLNLKQTRNSRALEQSQSFDFSYSSINGFKRVAICTALALGLINKPYLAHAEENAVTSNLQAMAESYAKKIILRIHAYILLVFACLIIPLSASADSVVIDRKNGITIDGASYTSDTDNCLTISNSKNITIKNANFINCYGVGVAISNSTNIRILTSYFEDLNGGVYAINSKTIKVNNNKFKNVSRIDHLDESRGQFVQFNRVTGAGNLIQSNIGINEPELSDSEDAVSLYMSSGIATSPIMVSGNCFKGGGPSESGGGIMTGDSGGSYQIVQNNTLVDVGQYGIGVASGTNIKVLNNHIYGQGQPFSNIGMYVWNQSEESSSCSNITVQGNSVDFTNSNGDTNPFWNSDNCGVITGETDNYFDSDQSTLDCSL